MPQGTGSERTARVPLQVALYAVLPISGVYLYQHLLRQRQKRLRSGRA
jgi:hypothetical protein